MKGQGQKGASSQALEAPAQQAPSKEELQALEHQLVGLVAERYGYLVAVKALQKDKSDKTKPQREKTTEVTKAVKKATELLVKTPTPANAKTVTEKREELVTAREALAAVAKPFNEKQKPLKKAVKFMDNIAIPDGLRELKIPVVPRFTLEKWVKDAVESLEKKD